MTFTPDFWIATATVAPVIALSATVAMGDLSKEGIRRRKSLIRGTPSWKSSGTLGVVSLTANYINIFWQSIVLLIALLSIANSNNALPPTFIAYAEAISIILVFIGIAANSLIRATVFDAPEGELKKPESSQ
jgi:hypothetical protein